ncbi:MarR family transcriptional regulator [Thermomonospora umbrina]|uniref:MarR family transcriptional regulator n=1 Tax=Thermomonospora umbrina TaxID=111806 RepID=A0A3D9T0A8_9ACTN|nr:MarR family transcriptional regulator [Thermomonospora umbrina]
MRDRWCEGPVPPDPVLRLPTHLVAEFLRLARRTSEELYPAEELRRPHVVTLAWLADQGPMSQRQVSERLRVGPADLVGVIDTLERLALVERRRDPADRRRYSLHLTDEGRRALRERRVRGERLNDTLLAGLTEPERDTLRSLLLKALAHHDGRFASAADQGPVDPPTE